MRISDWSSDVCSSDLLPLHLADDFGAQVLRSSEDVETLEAQPCGIEQPDKLRDALGVDAELLGTTAHAHARPLEHEVGIDADRHAGRIAAALDRKSTRLNSSH